MGDRDRGQQIRFDLLTATLEKDEEKIKQCKLLEKEEKQRLKKEKEQGQLAKKRKGEAKKRKSTTNTTIDDKASLETWFNSNIDNPYPTKKEKQVMMSESGLTQLQVERWFTAKRAKKRKTKPTTNTLEGYTDLHPNDILPLNWPSRTNVNFQQVIENLKTRYQSEPYQVQQQIAGMVVTHWKRTQRGRFVGQVFDDGQPQWKVLDDDAARERCTLAFKALA